LLGEGFLGIYQSGDKGYGGTMIRCRLDAGPSIYVTVTPVSPTDLAETDRPLLEEAIETATLPNSRSVLQAFLRDYDGGH
jgi:hypothetical protein